MGRDKTDRNRWKEMETDKNGQKQAETDNKQIETDRNRQVIAASVMFRAVSFALVMMRTVINNNHHHDQIETDKTVETRRSCYLDFLASLLWQ